MIGLEDIVVRAGTFSLGPVNLSIARGEHYVLLGPSGTGKSTLLELVAGFRKAASGRITLRGAPAESLPPQARRCAWVPQARTLFPHLSVFDNVAYGLRSQGASPEKVAARVSEIGARTGITHLLERSTVTLSGGERQRITLARALACEHDILLLDEPFSSLERGGRREMWRLVRELHRDLGLTIFHVTHDVEEARAFSARLGILSNGRIAQEGPPEAMLGQPLPEVAAVLGLDNLIAGEAAAGQVRIAGGRLDVTLEGAMPQGPVWLRFAPGAVHLGPQNDAAPVAFFGIAEVRGARLIAQAMHLEIALDTEDPLVLLAHIEDAKSAPPIGSKAPFWVERGGVSLRPRYE